MSMSDVFLILIYLVSAFIPNYFLMKSAVIFKNDEFVRYSNGVALGLILISLVPFVNTLISLTLLWDNIVESKLIQAISDFFIDIKWGFKDWLKAPFLKPDEEKNDENS